MATSHQPFHQKYRPSNLDELVGQDIISLTLKQSLLKNKIAPAYLFCGPRGTGKTSSARIFAKSLNCLNHEAPNILPCNKCELCKNISNGIALDIIEIDAASNTGVENIREIIERANFAPTQARWKVYVIDECHMLSTAASNALLKTIEEPPEKVIFILATTNPERVLKTIQSRCQTFEFRRISTNQINKHLLEIAHKESIQFEKEGLSLIAKRSNGGMRDAQSLLDQLSLLPNGITKKSVEELLGEVSEYDLLNLVNSLINNNPEALIKNCADLYDAGNEPIAILEGLLNITRDLLLTNIDSQYSDLFRTSKEFYPNLNSISRSINKQEIIAWHNELKNSEYQIKHSNQPRLWLEISLSSLINIKNEKENNAKNIDPVSEVNKKSETAQSEECLYKEIPIKSKNISNEKTLPTKFIKKNDPEFREESKTSYEISDNTDDNTTINLKEKWSLILSKVELPSTRMLLSQQAELLNIEANFIEIGLSPNWENMIKSRKVLIENAVQKIFGEHMTINYISKKNLQNKVITPEPKKNINDNPKNLITKKQTNSEANNEDEKIIDKNSSKNLADFFNGEIIETNE